MATNGFGFTPHDDSDDQEQNNNENGNNDRSQNNNPFDFLFGNNDSPLGNLFGGNDSPFGNLFGNNNETNEQDSAEQNKQPGIFAFGLGENGQSTASFSSLGDFINQFGGMLSGLSDPESAKNTVNVSMVKRTAVADIASVKSPSTHDSKAVTDSVALVELWLDSATALPAGATLSEAFNARQWVEQTLPTWTRFVTPLAEQLSEAALENIPEEAREQAGPMLGIIRQVNNMNFNVQLGHTLAGLAQETSQLSEYGFPLISAPTAGVNTSMLEDLAPKLGAQQREVLLYLAAREAAHQRLFQHVPWLAELLLLSIEDYAAGVTLDFSALEEITRNIDPEMLQNPEFMSNPSAMQEMMGNFTPEDLHPTVQSSHPQGKVRVETLLSLVEGWVDVVVGNALGDRIPETTTINAAWSSYRLRPDNAMKALEKTLGLSLRAPYADQAAQLWARLGQAVGDTERDAVWNHADFLPTLEDIEHPAAFIDKVISNTQMQKDFDPIAEIMRLEAQEREAEQKSSGNNPDTTSDDSQDDSSTGQ